MDETGRGSWAGPVVAAAVILPKWTKLPGLTDSKLLTASQREELYKKITKSCDYGIGEASHQEVDQFGLLHATFLAYRRALEKLEASLAKSKPGYAQPDHLMIDGRDKFKFKIPHTSVIKGDLKVRCISAASVLAKVHRDRIMTKLAKKHPKYFFELHKGYGTKRHQGALSQHGPSKIHRKSYLPVIKSKWKQTSLV